MSDIKSELKTGRAKYTEYHSLSTQLPAQCLNIIYPSKYPNRLQSLFEHGAEYGCEESFVAGGNVTAVPTILGHQYCYVSFIYISCVGVISVSSQM